MIEETFALKCSFEDFNRFLGGTRKNADGRIGFYWGKSPVELRKGETFADVLILAWLASFLNRVSEFRRP